MMFFPPVQRGMAIGRVVAPAVLCIHLITMSYAAEQTVQIFAPHSLTMVLEMDGFAEDRIAALGKLAGCGRDLVIVPPVYDGPEPGPWTKRQITAMRGSTGRFVLAHLPVTTVDRADACWLDAWDADADGRPDESAPDFLLGRTEDDAQVYRVKYWDHHWQERVVGCIDAAAEQGFDGIALDLAHAIEYFEFDPATRQRFFDRVNPQTQQTYRRDLVEMLEYLATYARQSASMRLVLRRADTLVVRADVQAITDGVVVENLFSDGQEMKVDWRIRRWVPTIEQLRVAQRPFMVIDYAQEPRLREQVIERADRLNVPLLLTDPALNSLGTMIH